jgi:phytoene desaturase
MRAPHVAVIGAGFGGLAAAAHLARAGVQVTVFEKAPAVGGKAARLERDGFHFDAGPTVLTMPWIAEETFAAAGVRLDQVVQLRRVEPVCCCVLPDGRRFAVSADAAATSAAIAQISRRDAASWPAFLADCRGLWLAAGEPYLEAPFTGFRDLGARMLRRGARLRSLAAARGSLADLARRHFSSPALRAYVDHFAAYVGASPAHASAALALIAHAEIRLGAYCPGGGMHEVASQLAQAVTARGVRIACATEVTGIDVDHRGRAAGIIARAVEGDRRPVHIAADAVVANVDPRTLVAKLLPERWRAAAGAARLETRTPSLSGFVWAFGVAGEWPAGAAHSLLLGRDPEAEYEAIFDRREIPDDPTIYLSVASLLDPDRAPPGHHTVYTLLNAPASAQRVDWNRESARLRALILARLERLYGGDIRSRIRAEVFVTPEQLAATGSVDGAIYGAAPHGPLGGFLRPGNRAAGIRRLYYAGGATHPGGGVTLAMRSGWFATELLLTDLTARDVARPRQS